MGYTPHILVIGGGVIGTGVARDLAIRGLDVTLVEKGTLAAGTTGQMQGLLYSGARRAATDPSVARQCLAENRTLREIAGHCLESEEGLLVSHETDAADQFETRVAACRECDIPVTELGEQDLHDRAPTVAAEIDRAVVVPDAVVDPFRLTVANAKGAQEHGADIRTHTEVTAVTVDDGTIGTVTIERDPDPTGTSSEDEQAGGDGTDQGDGENADDSGDASDGSPRKSRPGGPAHLPEGFERGASVPGGATTEEDEPDEIEEIEPDYVVNATGAWADSVAGLAGLDVPLAYSRGAMVVVDGRQTETPLTRCRRTEEANTIVPYGTNSVLGTTHRAVENLDDTTEPDDASVTERSNQSGVESVTESQSEVELLLDDLSTVAPALEDARALRSFCGLRSWYQPAGATEDEASTGAGARFTLVDHGEKDGCWGMTTVAGGSLTTHRLVAEQVVDDVCGKFGISRECRTDEIPLPGSENPEELDAATDEFGVDSPIESWRIERLGTRAKDLLDTDEPNPVICECQSVTRAEVRDALADDTGTPVDLNDVRIRTGATMGECQGGLCAHRLAAELYPDHDSETVENALDGLLAERWQGQHHTLWGEQLASAARSYRFHVGSLNRAARDVDFRAERPDHTGSTPEGRAPSDDSLRIDQFDDGPERESERSPGGERV